MNIFVLNNDPEIAARDLCDKHIVKMATESAQCLACAVIRHGATSDMMPLTKNGTPAKGGYHRHPCSLWAGDNQSNFTWLYLHATEICREYTRRYNKIHFCQKSIDILGNLVDLLPKGDLSQFVTAISPNNICAQIPNFFSFNSIVKYRLYYKLDKPFATWKYSNKPSWYDCSVEKIINSF